ncbi:MAG: class I SAM-dependent methyltransferase [Nitrospirae bacterium]|nr:class I SAM-dependent methyltransferase [Nitrospirota bacterium]
MFRRVTPGTGSRLTVVDHAETYGRHVLRNVVQKLDVSLCVDLGCGAGDDLQIVMKSHPAARCFGIDYGDWNKDKLMQMGIEPVSINIETERLPFNDESADLVIANQVFEHTKEIYWINHEIFRVLRVGGHLYLGVPNVLSLHNRILGLLGVHPTSAKMISAHLRVFSRNDTLLFYREIASDFASLQGFYGSQFYPFPGFLARQLARMFPSCAFSIFFLFRKTGPYSNQFIDRLSQVVLETNFFAG